ncbi:MAG TPA: RsmB/NOP family class I SAM-dependent RNA methyltransferase [Kiritimatiellia bacterium]|nr:RsmB/NOP family class I SAM-dependent RNA methyltransferase [Kiritimatiellia bacterium]HNS80902.1 RsmB/NOP family class I SAM-dependent RNA methyltransferase [Kiritimatiellia bacterium]
MQSADGNIQIQAAAIVEAQLEKGLFPDRLLDSVREQHGLLLELVYGAIRWRASLEWMIRELAPRPPALRLRALLLTGLYRLLYMNSAKPYFVVSECVDAARAAGAEKAARFVNAVLRNALRRRRELLSGVARQKPEIRLSCPEDLFRRWTDQWGREDAVRLCKWNNRRARTVLCIPAAMDSIRAALEKRKIAAVPHPFDPQHFLVLPPGCPVRDLPGYHDGNFTVQDPATTLAVSLLNPQPGEKILDACSAPGGKALMIAGAMRRTGSLTAMDLYPERLDRLKENMNRTGADFIRVLQGDAKMSPRDDAFDGILLDVPCSNTGVIRRRPDAKWRFSEKRLRELCRTQRMILDHQAELVKPGGRIVYSTCSLEPEENTLMVNHWLAAHPDFRLDESRLLFPPDSGTDGAFAARLVRNS